MIHQQVLDSVDELLGGFDLLDPGSHEFARQATVEIKIYLDNSWARFEKDWLAASEKRGQKQQAQALVAQRRRELEEAEAGLRAICPEEPQNKAAASIAAVGAPGKRKAPSTGTRNKKSAGAGPKLWEPTAEPTALSHFHETIQSLPLLAPPANNNNGAVQQAAAADIGQAAAENNSGASANEPAPAIEAAANANAAAAAAAAVEAPGSDVPVRQPEAVVVVVLEDDDDKATKAEAAQKVPETKDIASNSGSSSRKPRSEIKVVLDTAAVSRTYSDESESGSKSGSRSSSNSSNGSHSTSGSKHSQSSSSSGGSKHSKNAILRSDLHLSGISSASSSNKSQYKQQQHRSTHHSKSPSSSRGRKRMRSPPPAKQPRKAADKPMTSAAAAASQQQSSSNNGHYKAPSSSKRRDRSPSPKHRAGATAPKQQRSSTGTTQRPLSNIGARIFHDGKRH